MKQILAAILAFCLSVSLLALPVSADRWLMPEPFYILSEDGSRVFHVTPDPNLCCCASGWEDYPPTGLYYNTNPLTLIYLVEFPCTVLHEAQFFFSQDMQYFVWIPWRNGRGSFDGTEALALVFYANGTVQRTYMVSDLVRDMSTVRWTVTTAQWNYRIREFDIVTNQLTVQTTDFAKYVFDITTGEILIHRYPEPDPNDPGREISVRYERTPPPQPEVFIEPALDEPVHIHPVNTDLIASAAVALAAAIGGIALLIM